MNTAAVTNTTMTLKKRTKKVETKVEKLQSDATEFLSGFGKLVEVQKEASTNVSKLSDNFDELEAVVFELTESRKKAENNNTQLLGIYSSMEKHFVEMKQELFETKLQVC